MRCTLPLLLLLAACGDPEERFLDQHFELTCDLLEECSGALTESLGGCEGMVAAAQAVDGTCEFSKPFADSCIEELESWTCVDWAIEQINGRSACLVAYQGEACPWMDDAVWYLSTTSATTPTTAPPG